MRLPRLSPRAYQRITLIALVALVFIVVTGAAVRLTGSGLGCTDWPTCEQNQLVAPMGNLHAWIEFGNRLITGAVSIAVALAVLGSLVRVPRRRDLTWWSLGLVAGVIGQIVLGGLTVLFHLEPQFVIGHFVLSMALVFDAVVLHDRAGHDGSPGLPLVGTRIRWMGRALVALGALVVLTGTIVTGSGPHGGDATAPRLPFYLEDVARIHSLTMWTFLIVTVATLWMLHTQGSPLEVERRARWLVAAIVAQGAIGYLQYFTAVPPGLVALHVFGATIVWITVLRFHLGLTAHPMERPAGLPVTDTDTAPAPAAAGAP